MPEYFVILIKRQLLCINVLTSKVITAKLSRDNKNTANVVGDGAVRSPRNLHTFIYPSCS